MRPFFLLIAILFSGFCFGQSTGSIAGMVLDGEMDNSPLILANISVEGTSITSTSDENGYFYFENIEKGTYTLQFNFVGYESKELEVQVVSNKQTNVDASLVASSVSLNDLASLISNSTTATINDKASL
ncbi:MAG: carboxypeptidase-like regulatory domain-containing protein [Flavobacteriaceae bacterium]|jgi:hypothetical protein